MTTWLGHRNERIVHILKSAATDFEFQVRIFDIEPERSNVELPIPRSGKSSSLQITNFNNQI